MGRGIHLWEDKTLPLHRLVTVTNRPSDEACSPIQTLASLRYGHSKVSSDANPPSRLISPADEMGLRKFSAKRSQILAYRTLRRQ